ncbi:hypothetical protein LNV23_17715 [Paucibacter sp. DJ1R-11]|uniref:hypothetical protein n=1 Tax=Paucibacter sp. DJ1R-11 TaxID=2893556 RepID=UPI0021E3DCC7|nr:hypothetical protein [Paucibacter sp. DJ1R-11]MCV2365289.1 hypothetical protein [Paucibacter sp. DJ1R-11]
MKLKQAACGIATSCLFSVQAYQPVESGVLPLKERLSVMAQDQKRLDEQLSREDNSAEARALAWRRSKELAAEREQLERDIAQVKSWAQSPLLMHAAPTQVELRHDAQESSMP